MKQIEKKNKKIRKNRLNIKEIKMILKSVSLLLYTKIIIVVEFVYENLFLNHKQYQHLFLNP